MGRLFQAPEANEIVRLERKAIAYRNAHGWMPVDKARRQIDTWRKHAYAQGEPGSASASRNADRVVLSFFDRTGAWSQPWEDAGYQVFRFDIQNDQYVGDVNNFGAGFFGDQFGDFDGLEVYAILAACPCDHFAISGARHFAAKDEDGRTEAGVELVHQTKRALEYFRPAVWSIENPVGRIESLGGLPPWRLSFDPNHFGDPYTKKTLLWGRFNADLPIAPVDPVEGSKMHQRFGGSSLATKNARSVTPTGFAYAFFMANNAEDNPEMSLINTYELLCPRLLDATIKAGISTDDVRQLIADQYYMDLDYEGAERILRDELAKRGIPLDHYLDQGSQLAMWI